MGNSAFYAIRALAVGLGGMTLAIACPAHAQQTASDLDALIDGSTSTDRAMTLADTQEDQGDLLGAAATLERALLAGTGPAIIPVRLHYIALLCKLGDRPRASSEVGQLGGARVADDDWARVTQACGPLPRPIASNGGALFVGQVSTGIAYDSDALGALNLQFTFPGFTPPRDDGFSFIGSVDLAGRVPAGSNFLYGALSAVTKDNISGPALDYQVGDLHLGYGIAAGKAEISAGFFGRYGRLSGADFVGEYGGEARVALPVSTDDAVTLDGVVVHQRYAGSSSFFSRNGTRIDVELALQGKGGGGLGYVLGAGFEDKSADTSYLGYTGGRVFGAARVPLGSHGLYGAVSATVRHIAYRAPLFGSRQIETRYFARAAVGMPLVGGLNLEAAGSYTRRDYNAASFLAAYDSAGAELRLVWNFGQ